MILCHGLSSYISHLISSRVFDSSISIGISVPYCLAWSTFHRTFIVSVMTEPVSWDSKLTTDQSPHASIRRKKCPCIEVSSLRSGLSIVLYCIVQFACFDQLERDCRPTAIYCSPNSTTADYLQGKDHDAESEWVDTQRHRMSRKATDNKILLLLVSARPDCKNHSGYAPQVLMRSTIDRTLFPPYSWPHPAHSSLSTQS